MTRLSSHCDSRSSLPVLATAHTVPSAATIVAHMLLFRIRLTWLLAAIRLWRSSLQPGNAPHVPGGPPAFAAPAVRPIVRAQRKTVARVSLMSTPPDDDVLCVSRGRGER